MLQIDMNPHCVHFNIPSAQQQASPMHTTLMEPNTTPLSSSQRGPDPKLPKQNSPIPYNQYATDSENEFSGLYNGLYSQGQPQAYSPNLISQNVQMLNMPAHNPNAPYYPYASTQQQELPFPNQQWQLEPPHFQVQRLVSMMEQMRRDCDKKISASEAHSRSLLLQVQELISEVTAQKNQIAELVNFVSNRPDGVSTQARSSRRSSTAGLSSVPSEACGPAYGMEEATSLMLRNVGIGDERFPFADTLAKLPNVLNECLDEEDERIDGNSITIIEPKGQVRVDQTDGKRKILVKVTFRNSYEARVAKSHRKKVMNKARINIQDDLTVEEQRLCRNKLPGLRAAINAHPQFWFHLRVDKLFVNKTKTQGDWAPFEELAGSVMDGAVTNGNGGG